MERGPYRVTLVGVADRGRGRVEVLSESAGVREATAVTRVRSPRRARGAPGSPAEPGCLQPSQEPRRHSWSSVSTAPGTRPLVPLSAAPCVGFVTEAVGSLEGRALCPLKLDHPRVALRLVDRRRTQQGCRKAAVAHVLQCLLRKFPGRGRRLAPGEAGPHPGGGSSAGEGT